MHLHDLHRDSIKSNHYHHHHHHISAHYYLGVLGALTTLDACTAGDSTILTATECSAAFFYLGLTETSVADDKLCYKNGDGDGRQDAGNGGGARLICKLAGGMLPIHPFLHFFRSSLSIPSYG
jgi:hypothetical protein